MFYPSFPVHFNFRELPVPSDMLNTGEGSFTENGQTVQSYRIGSYVLVLQFLPKMLPIEKFEDYKNNQTNISEECTI